MPDTLQFVNAISSSPTVRLNLNDDTAWGLNYDGTDFSPPGLRRAVADTLLVDGSTYPAAAYEDRRLRMRLDLLTAGVDAAATQIQLLARELDRPANVLKWQPVGMTNPVFFRTIRSPATSVREMPGNGNLRILDVEVLAEPFALGLKQTLGTVSVSNNAAAGSNGLHFDVTSPLGDVETPLCLSIAGMSGGLVGAVAVRRRGTPSATPFLLQAEAMTPLTSTTLQPNDAVMSGSGQNYLRCGFASSGLSVRATADPFPSAASVDVRGTYRVFARYRKSSFTDVITMRMSATSDGQTVTGDTVTLPTTFLASGVRYVDLGLLQMPLGADPVSDGYSGTTLPARGVTFSIEAGRTSGAGNLDLDLVLFVPADDRLALIKWPATSFTLIVDGARDMLYTLGAGGEVRSAEFAQVAGGLPMISPGVTNRVFLVRDVGTTSGGDDITGTTSITPYYWPRYLYVRPATT